MKTLTLLFILSICVMGQDRPDSTYLDVNITWMGLEFRPDSVRSYDRNATDFEMDLIRLIQAQDEAIKLRDSIIQNYKDENRMYKTFIELLIGKKKDWIKKWGGDTSEDIIEWQYRGKTK
jgi:hypothetical protein